MPSPKYKPYLDGQGGVKIGLSPISESKWLEIDDLAKGLMCSKKSVYNYRDDGIFVAGVHYYSVGTGKVRGKHIYCLELCRQALIERTKRQQQKIEKAETYSKEEISKRIDRQIKPSQLSYRG